jgi:hypothetical protein
MASHQTFGQRGKILYSQAREIIAFMQQESEFVRKIETIRSYKI